MGHHHLSLVLSTVVGLALLAALPWPLALPIWLLLAITSTIALVYAGKALRAPITTGREAMLGSPVQILGSYGDRLQVRREGELWSAVSLDPLGPGDRARVTAVEGLRLVVVRDDTASLPLHAVAQARRTTTQALQRLQSRIHSLTLESEKRERAARNSLPAHEAAARAYLAQRQSLLETRARLEQQSQALRAQLDHLTALESSLRAGSAERRSPR